MDDLDLGRTRHPAGRRATSVSALPSSRPTLLPALEQRRCPADRAALLLPGRKDYDRVLLFGTPEVKLGRVRQSNDITLRVLPRSPDNDAHSRQISTQHLRVVLEPKGLALIDCDSTYGTALNGQVVKGSAPVPVDRISAVRVAQSLTLRLTPVLAASPGAMPDDTDYGCLGADDDTATLAAGLELTALLIERVDNLDAKECYLMLFNWAALGPALERDTGLPGGRMRLVRRGGQFWLHNRAASMPPVIEGIELPQGSICPLAAGMKLTIGSESVEFAEAIQVGI